jgi:hypothetical protein
VTATAALASDTERAMNRAPIHPSADPLNDVAFDDAADRHHDALGDEVWLGAEAAWLPLLDARLAAGAAHEPARADCARADVEPRRDVGQVA